MKRLSRTSRVLMLVSLAGLATCGCREQSLTMKYDSYGRRLIPVLKTGDVIIWRGIEPKDVRWEADDSPCDPNYKDGCKIKPGLSGLGFRYKCAPETPCDPEIAVDDGVGMLPKTLAVDGGTGPEAFITAYCRDGNLKLVTEGDVRAGQTLKWRAKGTNPPTEWKVVFEDPVAACGDSAPINSPEGSCKVQKAGDFKYRFTSTKQTCDKYSDETLKVLE